jgi:pimeloyl-ACP methyl ester carboxylesterase
LTGVEAFAEFFGGLRQVRDVVLFDQRGARLSSPLRCEAFSTAAALQAGLEAAASPVATPETELASLLPTEIGDPYEILQVARQKRAPVAADCAREIVATGVDLRQYNSIASATDTVALVKELGYDDYNIYGISYGTRLALVIMRDHPESGIRSVVLDSTFPPEVKGFERYPEESHEVVMQVFADCAVDPVCKSAYPSLKTRFIALLEQLHQTPIMTGDGIPITDRDLIEVMQGLSQLVQAVPYVPLMIDELERGEDATFLGIVSGSLFAEAVPDEALTDAEVAEAVAEAEDVMATLAPETAGSLSLARQFLLTVQAQIDALPEDDASRLLGLLLHLDKVSSDRKSLLEFVRNAFPEPEQAEVRELLLGLLAAMSDEDVREVFVVAEETISLFDFLTFGTSQPQFNAVECNEEIPFQSFENVAAVAQQLEIPELSMSVVEAMAGQFAICEVWPSGRAPAIEERPVTSDVPTLILAGSYDLQTPVSWNKSAFVTLPNGLFVEFPMSGHGVITYSPCAQGVAEAFTADPTALPDTSCVGDLKPQWVPPRSDKRPPAAATPVVGAGLTVMSRQIAT